jgi:hypothetical protein
MYINFIPLPTFSNINSNCKVREIKKQKHIYKKKKKKKKKETNSSYNFFLSALTFVITF